MNRSLLAALTVTALTLALGQPLHAQRSIDSLSKLKDKQASELVEKLTEEAEQKAAQAEQAARSRATHSRRDKQGGNIQIRRGNTQGLDQEQVGEGNFQSANVGTD